MAGILISYWSYLKPALKAMAHTTVLLSIVTLASTGKHFASVLIALLYIGIGLSISRLQPGYQFELRSFIREHLTTPKTQHGVLEQNISLAKLLSKIPEIPGREYSWIERICSNPKILSRKFEGTRSAEEFLYKNQFDKEIFIDFQLDIPDKHFDLDENRISIIALYPSGALRSVVCKLTLLENVIKVSLNDNLVFLDPDLDQPTNNIRDFRAQITVFAIQC